MSRGLWMLAVVACGGGSGGNNGGGGGDGDANTTGGNEPQSSDPVIELVPGELTFESLAIGETAEQFITVRNVGGAPLQVSQVSVTGDAFALVEPEADAAFDIGPGDLKYVDLRFTPQSGSDSAELVLDSNDPVNPQVRALVSGTARVPDLVVLPANHDFGNVAIPCEAEVELQIQNVGDEPVQISELTFTSSSGLFALDPLRTPSVPMELAPGRSESVVVQIPETALPVTDEGTLTLISNDPDGPVTAVQTVTVEYADYKTETFEDPVPPAVDIAFLVDTSCSMQGANQDDIQAGMPAFVQQLEAVSDWQMILVTKQGGCTNVGVLDPSVPDAAQQMIDHAFDGGDVNNYEKLLMLADKALDRAVYGDCNAGFLRPNAALHIIVASDEPDQSVLPWHVYLDRYRDHVIYPELVTVSAIADVNQPSCGAGAQGYRQIAVETEGALLDICNAFWGDQLTSIADKLDQIPPTYILEDFAVEETLEVTIEGRPTDQFVYVHASKALLLVDKTYIPGEDVVISYAVPGECL